MNPYDPPPNPDKHEQEKKSEHASIWERHKNLSSVVNFIMLVLFLLWIGLTTWTDLLTK